MAGAAAAAARLQARWRRLDRQLRSSDSYRAHWEIRRQDPLCNVVAAAAAAAAVHHPCQRRWRAMHLPNAC